jgi:DNA-binding transcriptional regulator LsrR (DeoR family)
MAAGGKEKVPIIKGGIKAGLCHTLVTDEATAQFLVQEQ